VHTVRFPYLFFAWIALHLSAPSQSLFTNEHGPRRVRTYDVVHYTIQVSFDEVNKKVFGTTTVTLTPFRDPVDSVVLDAVDMDVVSVFTSSGIPLKFTNRSPELAIYLPVSLRVHDTTSFSIRYICMPRKGLYFVQPDSNSSDRNQIWTQGADTDNRFWFPCYDHPDDKATSEVIATVPDRYTVLSNGRLLEVSSHARQGTRTFHWKQSLPHSSYLVMLAAGEYSVLEENSGKIPLQYYVYKEDVAVAPYSFRKTGRAMKFFEEKIGYPYPWDKYAQIIIKDFMWGGMENTSATTLNEIYIYDARAMNDFSADDVVAHELAHQWWGDLVTCRDWTHLWLNEGFATYFQAMFKEFDKGGDELLIQMRDNAKNIMSADAAFGRRPIVSEGSFTINLYQRGAWVLHMLRHLLGEQSFWNAMNHYVCMFAFKNADTRDFQRAVEEATGENLDWFFEQWVYKAGYPKLEVDRVWDSERSQLHLTMRQMQERDSLAGIFRFPLDIEVVTPFGTTSTTTWIAETEHSFSIPLAGRPLMVTIDKDLKLLKELKMERPKEELVFQVQHAEQAVHRIEAARELRQFKEDTTAFEVLSRLAGSDPHPAVRAECALGVGVMKFGRVKETLFKLCGDSVSQVRVSAIAGFRNFPSHDVADSLVSIAFRDSSYLVVSACLNVIPDVDSARAFTLAERLVDVHSYREIIRRAALGVFQSLKDPRALVYARKYSLAGNALDIRQKAISILGSLGREDSASRALLFRLARDGGTQIRESALEEIGEWKDSESIAFLRMRRDSETDQELRELLVRLLGGGKPPGSESDAK
jgi:aminopeptidase N